MLLDLHPDLFVEQDVEYRPPTILPLIIISTMTEAPTKVPRILLCRDIPTKKLDEAEQAGRIVVVRRGSSRMSGGSGSGRGGAGAGAGASNIISASSNDDASLPAPRQWIIDHIHDADAVIVTLTEPVRLAYWAHFLGLLLHAYADDVTPSCVLCYGPTFQIDAAILDAGSRLQVVSSMSVGTDHIDVERAKARGIQIGTTPNVLDDAVAELTLFLVLGATRKAADAMRVVREGDWGQHPWAPMAFCGPALRGKTIGFIGFGNIAQSTAALLPVFQPSRILYATSTPRPFEFNAPSFARLKEKGFPADRISVENEPDIQSLAAASDVLIVLTTLNTTTKHLVDEKILQAMKPTSVLVNTSRGPIVHTDALVQALESDAIAGAGLDVLEGEPSKLLSQLRRPVLPILSSWY